MSCLTPVSSYCVNVSDISDTHTEKVEMANQMRLLESHGGPVQKGGSLNQNIYRGLGNGHIQWVNVTVTLELLPHDGRRQPHLRCTAPR